jgi:hypothetical protein
MCAAAGYECPECQNKDEREFVEDDKSGDVVCKRCGAVVQAHMLFDGEWARHFEEDDEDPGQHGAPADPLFSSAYNMRTEIGAVDGAAGSGGRDMRRVQAYVDEGIGAMQREQKGKLRVAYKDSQKRHVFNVIRDVCTRVHLSEAVANRARALFAAYRDVKGVMQRRDWAVAACILEARKVELAGAAAVAAAGAVAAPGAAPPGVGIPCRYCGERFPDRARLRAHEEGPGCAGVPPDVRAARDAKRAARERESADRARLAQLELME